MIFKEIKRIFNCVLFFYMIFCVFCSFFNISLISCLKKKRVNCVYPCAAPGVCFSLFWISLVVTGCNQGTATQY